MFHAFEIGALGGTDRLIRPELSLGFRNRLQDGSMLDIINKAPPYPG
jgi:hypothetical protein